MVKTFTSIHVYMVCLVAFVLSGTTLFANEDMFGMNLSDLATMQVQSSFVDEKSAVALPQNVTILTKQDIARLQCNSIPELISHASGMFYVDDWFDGEILLSRGYYSPNANGNYRLLLNGVPINIPWLNETYFDLVRIPMEAIEKVEIVRGPASSRFGNSALNGSVNIVTRGSDTDGPISTLQVGSDGSFKSMLSFGKSSEDQEYIGVFGLDYDAGPDVSVGTLTDFAPPTAAATTHGGRDRFGRFGSFSGLFDGFSVEFFLSESTSGVYYLSPSLPGGSNRELMQSVSSVGYAFNPTEALEISSKIVYTNFRAFTDLRILDPSFDVTLDVEMKTVEGILEFDYTVSDNVALFVDGTVNAILSAKNTTHAPAFDIVQLITDFEKEAPLMTYSAASGLDVQLTDDITVSGGLRFQVQEAYGRVESYDSGLPSERRQHYWFDEASSVTPELGLVWAVAENALAKVNYGQGVRFNSFAGAEKVFAEKSEALEAVLRWSPETWVEGKVALYTATFADFPLTLTSIDSVGVPVVTSITDGGEISTKGIELECDVRPLKSLAIHGSASYSVSSTFGQPESSFAPSLLGKLWITYSSAYGDLTVSALTQGETHSAFDPTALQSSGEIGSFRSKATGTQVLVNANYKLPFEIVDGLQTYFCVQNITDTNLNYPATESSVWAEKGTVSKGRSFWLKLTMNY